MRYARPLLVLVLAAMPAVAQEPPAGPTSEKVQKTSKDAPTVTARGYVIDSACAFTKDLAKPISKQCATACANAGSPLVILAEDGTIYWPIAATTPSSGQNSKLLPFAAGRVAVTGKVYQRGGSKAIVIEKIEPQPAGK